MTSNAPHFLLPRDSFLLSVVRHSGHRAPARDLQLPRPDPATAPPSFDMTAEPESPTGRRRTSLAPPTTNASAGAGAQAPPR
jgi:hypothetical protein